MNGKGDLRVAFVLYSRAESVWDFCGSGLASRKGCKAAPALCGLKLNPGAALRPFRDARPLPQLPRQPG